MANEMMVQLREAWVKEILEWMQEEDPVSIPGNQDTHRRRRNTAEQLVDRLLDVQVAPPVPERETQAVAVGLCTDCGKERPASELHGGLWAGMCARCETERLGEAVAG